jgi:hypothetical protein
VSKPVIFTISASWDDEASVWSGHCDDIPAAANAPTLDELLAKISAMTLDLLPDNHPGIAPSDLFLQSRRCAKLNLPRRKWRRSLTDRCAICCVPPAARWSARQGQPRDLAQPHHQAKFAVPVGIPSRHTANAILRQAGLPKAF